MNEGRVPWNKGKPWSKEMRNKISESCKGRTSWNKGIIGPANHSYGIPRTEEVKRKVSEAQKGKTHKGHLKLREERKGKTHEEIFGKEKAEKMRKANIEKHKHKDPWNKGLTVHHIDYDKENISDENLITLCNIHNVVANSDRDKWEFLYTNLNHLKSSQLFISC